MIETIDKMGLGWSGMMSTPPAVNGVVTLNVGGTQFVTTRQTLLADPDSMLAKMFDPMSPLQPGETSTVN